MKLKPKRNHLSAQGRRFDTRLYSSSRPRALDLLPHRALGGSGAGPRSSSPLNDFRKNLLSPLNCYGNEEELSPVLVELEFHLPLFAYLTNSIKPSFDVIASGVLPYAPRLTRQPHGLGSFLYGDFGSPASIAGDLGRTWQSNATSLP